MGLKDVVRSRGCIKPGCHSRNVPDSNYCALHDPHETPEERFRREAQAEVDAICTSLRDYIPPRPPARGTQEFGSLWTDS